MHCSARSRAAVVVSAGVLATVLGSSVAQAHVDRVDSFVDGRGKTVVVTQSDTHINGVAPLDGSPLTKEWFHNGRISVAATGAEAAAFSGTVSVGYQFAYPMSIGGAINVTFDSPQASATITAETTTPDVPVEEAEPGEPGDDTEVPEGETEADAPESAAPVTTITADGSLVVTSPKVGTQLSLTPGPGTQEVEIASADVTGELSQLQFANIHGSATGVLGNLTIRPYVKVTSADGSSVVSYGEPQILS